MLGVRRLVGGRSHLILLNKALVSERGHWFNGYIDERALVRGSGHCLYVDIMQGTGQWQGPVGFVRILIEMPWKPISTTKVYTQLKFV